MICSGMSITSNLFLSTLSLRRATAGNVLVAGGQGISIHALLAESDGHRRDSTLDYQISIHALLAESDRRSAVRWTG